MQQTKHVILAFVVLVTLDRTAIPYATAIRYTGVSRTLNRAYATIISRVWNPAKIFDANARVRTSVAV